ncbi:MAG: hypothetical protein AAGH99_05930 [Planctomycetota bacterium]
MSRPTHSLRLIIIQTYDIVGGLQTVTIDKGQPGATVPHDPLNRGVA